MNSQINKFCAAKLHLIPIPTIDGKPTKAPRSIGWNRIRGANNPGGYSAIAGDFADCEGFNIGLYHGASNTLALDLDDVELARKVFDDTTDFQLLAWLENDARVEIKSPKANRGKLLFKLPVGFDGGLKQFKFDGKVIFELRSGNCQDVIYGQHPEGGDYQFIGNPAAIPEAPAVLLNMLQHWDDWKPCLDSALGVEQEPPKVAAHKPQQGSNLKGYRDPIQEFNQACSVLDVLIRNGYKQVGKDRFIRPGSSSQAPGVTIMRNCAAGIERVFSHGGDALNDGFAHDAFDCYRLLERGGEWNSALNWSPEITNNNQRVHMAEQAKNRAESPPRGEKVAGNVVPFNFAQFSINEDVTAMKKAALEQRYVLDGIALVGQVTVIYAKPNTGKTLLLLWLLIKSANDGLIDGSNVHYVNADDDGSGLLNKAELLKQHGINTVSPGYKGFEAKHLTDYLRQMVKSNGARGQIIALDTLKKFTELMDKKIASDFMRAVREFIIHGGTMILLAHTNKNRDANGKAVAGGTSDIIDDADCAYMLDAISDDGSIKQVLFENIKMRGSVLRKVAYSYRSTDKVSWLDRFSSIKRIDDELLEDAKKQKDINSQMEKDSELIHAIVAGISGGATLKTDLINDVRKELGISRERVVKALNKYTGTNLGSGYLWRAARCEKGAAVTFHLLSLDRPTTADDYRAAKNGVYQ